MGENKKRPVCQDRFYGDPYKQAAGFPVAILGCLKVIVHQTNNEFN
jgi:hypothetical protein